MLFNVRSKADISQLNLPHRTKNYKVENRKKVKSKRNGYAQKHRYSPENPWSQSWKRKGKLRWEGFAEKEGFTVSHWRNVLDILPKVALWRGRLKAASIAKQYVNIALVTISYEVKQASCVRWQRATSRIRWPLLLLLSAGRAHSIAISRPPVPQ